mmetsp:Transcript_6400/g.11092  ORF Transcript_6400/g.11092 Transcript_6400/m.11092 type:complete len:328 (-) Transcript_6400:1420-2403(-)
MQIDHDRHHGTFLLLSVQVPDLILGRIFPPLQQVLTGNVHVDVPRVHLPAPIVREVRLGIAAVALLLLLEPRILQPELVGKYDLPEVRVADAQLPVLTTNLVVFVAHTFLPLVLLAVSVHVFVGSREPDLALVYLVPSYGIETYVDRTLVVLPFPLPVAVLALAEIDRDVPLDVMLQRVPMAELGRVDEASSAGVGGAVGRTGSGLQGRDAGGTARAGGLGRSGSRPRRELGSRGGIPRPVALQPPVRRFLLLQPTAGGTEVTFPSRIRDEGDFSPPFRTVLIVAFVVIEVAGVRIEGLGLGNPHIWSWLWSWLCSGGSGGRRRSGL